MNKPRVIFGVFDGVIKVMAVDMRDRDTRQTCKEIINDGGDIMYGTVEEGRKFFGQHWSDLAAARSQS